MYARCSKEVELVFTFTTAAPEEKAVMTVLKILTNLIVLKGPSALKIVN